MHSNYQKYLYSYLYFDLNRTKYSVLQEINIDLDLIAVFSLKQSQTCSPYWSLIEYIREYKYY